MLRAATVARRDIVGAAETGSGKTLAFALPIISALETQREIRADRGRAPRAPAMRALILTPTRELGVQVARHIEAAARCSHVRVATVIGGMAPQKQRRVIERQPVSTF